MNNLNYDSLANVLKQNGMIPQSESVELVEDNFFNVKTSDFSLNEMQQEKSVEIPKALRKESKRLNHSDMEMICDSKLLQNSNRRIVRRFLNFKENMASKGSLGFFETCLFALFPKIYKAKLAKDAMRKINELNIDIEKLSDKNIPYGEGEMRYQSLIKYISFANEIQTKIKKEID